MKKRNRLLACIASALVLASCVGTAIPVLAAEVQQEVHQNDDTAIFLQENSAVSIASETTEDLPLDEANMTQHEKTVTLYSNGSKDVDIIKGYTEPKASKSGWLTAHGSHMKEKWDVNGKVIARLYVYCDFRYDSEKQLVERTKYWKDTWFIDSGVKLGNFSWSIDTGAGGLWWKPWANVIGKFHITYGISYANINVEVKCDTDGHIEGK